MLSKLPQSNPTTVAKSRRTCPVTALQFSTGSRTRTTFAQIREDLLVLLSGRNLGDTRLRNLGDGVDDLRDAKILEVLSPSTLQPQLLNSRFFQRALHVTRAVIGADARLLFDHFITKPPFNATPTAWHQDCAYWRIKRRAARRLHSRLPLQDIGMENGCMQFVPGSHLGPVLTHAPRSAGAYALRANSAHLAEPVTCPLAVGGATVHLPKTVHYAGPNNSGAARHAWIVQIGFRD
jgi:hypothetical protein